ncbi:MAG: PDZ domain-containing protein [Gemmatimonadota bacterium]|nr:MAG: PDZ domain-containing protein [Gemmatimonadota bacterium]
MRLAQLALAGALLIAGVAQPVWAQEDKEDERGCVCECRGIATAPYSRVQVWPGGGDWPQVTWFSSRPRLGVWIHTEANPETDRYGALIDEVSEGSPAEKAGIREGDIITKLDGVSLLEGDESYDEDESAPGMRLIERARKLEVGDTVEVEFRRDGDIQTVELAVGDFDEPFALSLAYGFPETERIRGLVERLREIPEVRVRARDSFALTLGATLPGLELVSLNPGLGEYFGTEEGVLVISVPEDSELGLRAGDVIQSIDGRAIRSPSHAMRILRSYNADEEVTFEILRKDRRESVQGKVSDDLGLRGRVLRIEEREK